MLLINVYETGSRAVANVTQTCREAVLNAKITMETTNEALQAATEAAKLFIELCRVHKDVLGDERVEYIYAYPSAIVASFNVDIKIPKVSLPVKGDAYNQVLAIVIYNALYYFIPSKYRNNPTPYIEDVRVKDTTATLETRIEELIADDPLFYDGDNALSKIRKMPLLVKSFKELVDREVARYVADKLREFSLTVASVARRYGEKLRLPRDVAEWARTAPAAGDLRIEAKETVMGKVVMVNGFDSSNICYALGCGEDDIRLSELLLADAGSSTR